MINNLSPTTNSFPSEFDKLPSKETECTKKIQSPVGKLSTSKSNASFALSTTSSKKTHLSTLSKLLEMSYEDENLICMPNILPPEYKSLGRHEKSLSSLHKNAREAGIDITKNTEATLDFFKKIKG